MHKAPTKRPTDRPTNPRKKKERKGEKKNVARMKEFFPFEPSLPSVRLLHREGEGERERERLGWSHLSPLSALPKGDSKKEEEEEEEEWDSLG